MDITLSIVVPVYSGYKYLEELVSRIAEMRQEWIAEEAPIYLAEAIFVDDGSKDYSNELLNKLSLQYDWIIVLTLSKNFGQHSATVTGICHSSSDWIVTMDEDLQHRPEDINSLLKAAVKENADVVYAEPIELPHGKSWRDSSSRLVKTILARMTGIPQITIFNSFRLIRGNIARVAASSSSSQTYLDIAISWFTNSYISIKLDMLDKRFVDNQKSGYSLIKLIQHARSLIISSQLDIASIGILIGGLAIMTSIVFGTTVIIQKIFFPYIIKDIGWTSLVALIVFFSAVIIVLLCILMDYINVFLINQLGKPTSFTIDRSQDSILSAWYKEKESIDGISSK